MVVLFNGDTAGRHGQQHFGTHVLHGVGGRNWEVTFFVAGFVAEVATHFFATGIPTAFDRVNKVVATILGLVKAHVIKDKKFGFGAKVGGITKARGGQIINGFLGNHSGATLVGLACAGLFDAANETQGRLGHERVEPSGVGIRHHHHVRFVDGLPAANTGAIEGHPGGEAIVVDLVVVHRQMLPDAGHVDKLEVDHLNALVFNHRQDFLSSRWHAFLR